MLPNGTTESGEIKVKSGKRETSSHQNTGGKGTSEESSKNDLAQKLAEEEGQLEANVLNDLAARVSWDKICARYHISSKTILKIKRKALGGSSNSEGGSSSLVSSQAGLKQYGPLGKRWAGKTLGEMAATAFRLFQKDMQPFAAVKKLKPPPKLVKQFFEDYKEMSSHDNIFCRISCDRGYEAGYNECLKENGCYGKEDKP